MTEDPTRLTFRNATTEAAERQATALERIAVLIEAIPDPLERIAEALDTIAALLAGPAALKATDADPYHATAGSVYKDTDGWVAWTGGKGVDAEFVPPELKTGKYVEIDIMQRGQPPIMDTLPGWVDWRDTGDSWNVTHYRIRREEDQTTGGLKPGDKVRDRQSPNDTAVVTATDPDSGYVTVRWDDGRGTKGTHAATQFEAIE
jgi:hypothetical protein